jgi:hypothetical protein
MAGWHVWPGNRASAVAGFRVLPKSGGSALSLCDRSRGRTVRGHDDRAGNILPRDHCDRRRRPRRARRPGLPDPGSKHGPPRPRLDRARDLRRVSPGDLLGGGVQSGPRPHWDTPRARVVDRILPERGHGGPVRRASGAGRRDRRPRRGRAGSLGSDRGGGARSLPSCRALRPRLLLCFCRPRVVGRG